MDYSEICQKMIHSSFDSKMLMAHDLSRKTMSISGSVSIPQLRYLWLPDEIETFVIFAVVANEWKDDPITIRQAQNMLLAIRQYAPPTLREVKGEHFAEWFIPLTASNQFENEEYSIYRLYRHWYYFNFHNNNINVKEAFINKFGCEYDVFLSVIWFLWIMECIDSSEILVDVLHKIAHTYSEIIRTLLLSRKEFIEELKQFTHSAADYRYCLRPLYSYPFIEFEGVIYLPTPHLLIHSITTAMMNRLTYENLPLREKIGKYAFESYLYDAITESALFDEVICEQTYTINGREMQTTDVMASVGKYRVLFDSKSFTPKAELRNMSEEIRKAEIDRLAKHVYQVYKQARKRFGTEYNFFSDKDIDWDKVFGLVVVNTDPVLPLHLIYNDVAKKANIELASDEYYWLAGHIGIVPIAMIERYCFNKCSIVTALQERLAMKRYDDIWLSADIDSHGEIQVIVDFKEKLYQMSDAAARYAYMREDN